jgi:hypothetical protein
MTLIARPGSHEQMTRACLDVAAARDIALMPADAHTAADRPARGMLPAAVRRAAAVPAEADSPYDLHDLADAVGETAARLDRAVRDALAEVPDHIPAR